MKSLTYIKIFAPLIITQQIFGSWPFRRVNNHLQICRLRLIYSAFSITITIFLTAYFFLNYSYLPSGIIQILVSFRNVTSVSLMSFLIITNYIHASKIISIIHKLLQIDQKLIKFKLNYQLVKSNRKIYKTVFVLVILNFVVNSISGLSRTVIKKKLKLLYFFISTYPRIIIFSFNISYCVFTMLVEDRLKIVNNLIKIKKIKSRSKHNWKDSKLEDFVYDVTTWRDNLVEIMRNINSVYNLNIFSAISINFLFLIFDLYMTVYNVFFGFNSDRFSSPSLALNSLIYIFDITYITTRSVKVCFEVRKNSLAIITCQI